MGLVVEDVDPDANGGTCVDLRNENYVEVHLYFSNGDKASLVAHSWCEMLTEASWPEIRHGSSREHRPVRSEARRHAPLRLGQAPHESAPAVHAQDRYLVR